MLWRKGNRYYAIGIQYNLWGTQDVLTGWGDLHSKLGNNKFTTIQNPSELDVIIEQITKRRRERKYELVRNTIQRVENKNSKLIEK